MIISKKTIDLLLTSSILIMMSLVSLTSLPVSHASVKNAVDITAKNTASQKVIQKPAFIVPNFEKELSYSFKIADKLDGKGAVNLSIIENKILGQSRGLGNTKRCKVDLVTNLSGVVNDKNGAITVSLNGVADPIKIPIPGKVTFNGPLTGEFKNGILFLTGTVNVDGYLASTAGFNSTEKVLIEIKDDVLYKGFMDLKNKLASNV